MTPCQKQVTQEGTATLYVGMTRTRPCRLTNEKLALSQTLRI